MADAEYTDWRLDAIVALENAAREIRAVKERLSEDVRRDEQCFDAIMAEVKRHNLAQQEDTECAANMGTPCCDPAPGFETRTHAFAALQESAGICTDHDEPPSRAL